MSVTELETDANRVAAAASSESDEEKAERLRTKRSLRTGTDAEGMGYGHWQLPPAPHARLMALIDANKDRIFSDARKAGVRESSEAYAADALAALADRPTPTCSVGQGPGRDDGADGVDDRRSDGDWRFAKVIVRVDAAALDRGEVAEGEVCEVAGQGPIPVTTPGRSSTVAPWWRPSRRRARRSTGSSTSVAALRRSAHGLGVDDRRHLRDQRL